jgi:MscS family membrane protein
MLDRLEREGLFDPETLSDDPAAESGAIGRDPILLVLARRQEDGNAETGEGGRFVWQFSAEAVADIPLLYEKLDELVAAATDVAVEQSPTSEPVAEGEIVDPLRSPYHMVQHFILNAQAARNDPAKYAEALRCLDFSVAQPVDLAKDGARYVDDVLETLIYLRDRGVFDREVLPVDPSSDDSFAFADKTAEILIVRQGRQWRFGGRTVAKIAEMAAAVRRSSTSQPTAEIPLDNSTPAATLNVFLTAMRNNDLRTAVSCLDLSQVQDRDPSVTHSIAGKILLVLNRVKLIVPSDYVTPLNDARVVLLKEIAGRIELVRIADGHRQGEWLFSDATVRQIDGLYEEWESEPILPELWGQRFSFVALPSLYVREYFISPSLKQRWGGLQYWQWLGLLLTVLLGYVVRQLCSLILPPIGQRLLSTKHTAILPATVRKGLRPTFNFVMVLVWWGGLVVLDLGLSITLWLSATLRIVVTVFAVAAFYALIDLATAYFSARAARTVSRLDDVLVPLLQKTLKVVVIAIGAVVVAKVFGFHVGPLLAGLGVGGLAFGLAAQDTLKNFFGSVNVVLDRPFQVGDWVRIGDTEGTVETVGLRSSRIRTFYNSEVTVPNSGIMNAVIDNMGRRRYRRISTKLGVLYSTTPEQLDAFCEGIRELIRTHPYTRKDYFHVYVNEFADSSINIMLYCFHECPDWGTELRERHRLLLDIMRLAKRLGVEFAFPTQTLHMHHESNPGDEPPGSPAIPGAQTGAEELGRDEARGIVRELLGDDGHVPPPVTSE